MRVILAALAIAAVRCEDICNLAEHMQYKFTECNPETGTKMVFFHYPTDMYCDTRPNKSEKLPIPMVVSCFHECPDAFYSGIEL